MSFYFDTPASSEIGDQFDVLYSVLQCAKYIRSESGRFLKIIGDQAIGDVLELTQINAGTFSNPDIVEWIPNGGAGGDITVNTGTGLTGGAVVPLGGTLNLAHADYGIAGTYGSGAQIPVITVNAQGHITTVAQIPVSVVGAALDSILTRNWKAGSSSYVGASDCVSVGDTAGTFGLQSVAIGSTAYSAANSVAVGYGARANAANTTVVGAGTEVRSSGLSNTVVGASAASGLGPATTGARNTLMGYDAECTGTSNDDVVVGYNASSTGSRSVSVGVNSVSGNDGVAVGEGASSAALGVAVGSTASSAANSVAVGDDSAALFDRSVCVGQSGASGIDGVSVGHDVDSTTKCVSIGSSSRAVVAGSVAIGYKSRADISNDAICIGSESVSGGVLVGANANANNFTTTVVGNGNTIVSTGINNTVVGYTSGVGLANAEANNTICGAQSDITAAGDVAVVLGSQNTSAALRANILGVGLTNTEANSTLIGSTTAAHVLKTTGFMRSLLQVSACAGVLPTETAITIGPASSGDPAVVLDLVSTRFDKFEPLESANVNLLTNRINLGTVNDADHTFQVSATVGFTSTGGTDRWSLLLYWVLEGTPFVVAAVAETTGLANTLATMTTTTIISLPPVLLTRSYVYCTMQRVAGFGTTTATISNWRLAMSRIN